MKSYFIDNFEDLNEINIQNYNFNYIDNILSIQNAEEGLSFNFDTTKLGRLKILNRIKEICGIKIKLKKLNDREVLEYIQSKGFNKTLWSAAGKSMHDFNMIEAGDKIAVGISGGKDSLTLLNLLVRVKKICGFDFEIIPIHIHPNTDSSNCDDVIAYTESLGLKLQIIETDLEHILFSKDKKVKNPCFLCGRIRRGILYRVMKEQNINKLALGHHKDDIIETYLMNMFYQGNLNAMRASYVSKEYGVTVIRPMAYVEERTIIKYSKKIGLPVLKSECPYETSDDSKRLKMKHLIDNLSKENKDIRNVMLNSLKSENKL